MLLTHNCLCILVLSVVLVYKMASTTDTPVGKAKQRPCPKCSVNILRRTEAHTLCFDCLDHGPMSIPDLRCEICKLWATKAFMAATAKYDAKSQSRLEAIELSNRDQDPITEVQETPKEQEESMDTQEPVPTPDTPIPPPPGFVTLSTAELQANILAVLQQTGLVPPVGESGEKRKKPRQATNRPSSSSSNKKPKKKDGPSSFSGRESSSMARDSSAAEDPIESQLGADRNMTPIDAQEGASRARDQLRSCTSGEWSTTQGGNPVTRSSEYSDFLPPWSLRAERHGQGTADQAHLGASVDRRPTGMLGAAMRPGMSPLIRSRISGHTMGQVSSLRDVTTDRINYPTVDDNATITAESRSGTGRDLAEDDPQLSDDLSETGDIGSSRSNFRWAVEQCATLMGLPPPVQQPTRGTGRFATTPVTELIALPMADTLVKQCTAINQCVTGKKEVGRSEPTFPSLSLKAKSLKTYASSETQGFVTTTPSVDEAIGLLAKKKNVWSATLKKSRLSNWQTMSHHVMGQLSSADHFTKLVQEIVDMARTRSNKLTLEPLSIEDPPACWALPCGQVFHH